jgi:hypothetical protein
VDEEEAGHVASHHDNDGDEHVSMPWENRHPHWVVQKGCWEN